MQIVKLLRRQLDRNLRSEHKLLLRNQPVELALMCLALLGLKSEMLLHPRQRDLVFFIEYLFVFGTTLDFWSPMQARVYDLMQAVLKLALDLICNSEAELDGVAECR